MAELSKEAEEKVSQLQLYEQSLQNLLSQKQQFQMRLAEIESALKELEKTDSAYKIVGNIMVSSDKAELKKDLESKKEMSELRVKALEKQETQIKQKAEKLQEEVLNSIKGD
ncbi:prefoldin subunit beta [Candidatus Woesearchaeota archaeon]|nr:prefoldin subunit beta [Candidatus Woesearchaeota archaeon]